jgi:hypothetical protein
LRPTTVDSNVSQGSHWEKTMFLGQGV